MPRAKKVLKRKGAQKGGQKGQRKKNKENKEIENYDPKDKTKPIPVGYKLWADKKGASLTTTLTVIIVERRARRDIEVVHASGKQRRDG
jgi:hypothetical protein